MSKDADMFNEMLDPAFAEIYYTAISMEKDGRIGVDHLTTEELVHECKMLAVAYVRMYEELGSLSYWDDLYAFAEKKLQEKFPPQKSYTALIQATICCSQQFMANNQEEAEEMARVFVGRPYFKDTIRSKGEIENATVTKVSLSQQKKG